MVSDPKIVSSPVCIKSLFITQDKTCITRTLMVSYSKPLQVIQQYINTKTSSPPCELNLNTMIKSSNHKKDRENTILLKFRHYWTC